MTLMKLRLDFIFTDRFQHFGIYLVVFTLKFFILRHVGKSELKSFMSYNHNPNIKPEIFKI